MDDRPYQSSLPPIHTERFAAIRTWLLVAITVVLVGWALRAIGAIAVPLVFAFFLALVVAPIDRWVSDRVPGKVRWLGHVAAMTCVVLVVMLFVASLWLSAQQVIARFPADSGGLASLIPDLSGGSEGGAGAASLAQVGQPDGAGATGQAGARASGAAEGQAAGQGGGLRGLIDALRGAAGSFAGEFSNWATSAASAILTMAGSFLSAIVLVFFLTLLMLVEAPRWRDKLRTLFDRPARDGAFDAIAIIAQRLRTFLLVRLVLGLITAALYVGWLWIFGVELLLVWGVLTVLLNFVPTIGSLISGALPVLYAFITKDFGTAILVGVGLLAIEQVMGNYVDPRVQGRTVSLSPLVIVVALLLWGWIWGVAGAFLAVPITIAALVIGAHIRALRPLALLISNETTLQGLEGTAGR